jgi:hypothetical protein
MSARISGFGRELFCSAWRHLPFMGDEISRRARASDFDLVASKAATRFEMELAVSSGNDPSVPQG